MIEIIKDKKFKYIYFFILIISIQLILGKTLNINGTIAENIILNIIQIFILSIILTFIYYMTYNIAKKIKIKKYQTKEFKNNWIIYFLIIIISWIPAFIAFCPVILNYDGPTQIYGFSMKGIPPSTRQPIISTLMFDLFYKIGLNLFNSVSLGMAFLSIFQMIIMSSIFAFATEFIYRETKNKIITIISLLFYALFPINQVFPLMTTKDVMFSGFGLLFVIKLYELIKKDFKIKEYNLIVLIGILMLLFRNNAIYALIALIPFIIVILKKDKKKCKQLIIVIALIIILYQASFNLLIFVVKGQKDNDREKLSIMTQAIARVAKLKMEELNEQEIDKIIYYFGDVNELVQVYEEHLSDRTKERVRTSKIEENEFEFIKFFIGLGIKYPIIYIDSFLKTIQEYWYLEDYAISDKKMSRRPCLELGFTLITDGTNTICDYNLWPELRSQYKKLLEQNNYMKIPVLNMIFQSSFYFYVLIGCMLYLKYKNNKKNEIPVIFLFLYFVTCFLGPGGFLRYVYINVISTPVVISYLVPSHSKNL